MVFADEKSGRTGFALDSLVYDGSIISGEPVERSILSPDVRISSYSLKHDSILFHWVKVGRHAQIRRAIIDKGMKRGFVSGNVLTNSSPDY